MLGVKNFLEEKSIIIADDLTGANEIAAIMMRKRKRSLVLNTPVADSKIRKLWNTYQGLVFNLNSRNLPEQKAYIKIKGFLISSEEIRKRLIYKKIDSTLRGNVGKEIDAVLDVGCADLVVLVPAFPRIGRVTVGGYHLVEQVPVGRTSYAVDFSESSLLGLLRTQSNYRVGYVGLQTVESGPRAISQQLIGEYKKESLIVVCDCCTQDDLKNIKQAIRNLNLKVLAVGSAGLFEELFYDEPCSLPCLIVCGSLNRITRFQLTKLINQEKTGYLEFRLFSLLSGDDQNKLKRLLMEGKAILNQGKNLVIATAEKRWEIKEKQEIDMTKAKINRSLAYLAKHFIKRYPLAGVVATGGDTAKALLDSLQAQGIEAIDELEPLVPVDTIKGGKWEGMIIVTKAGGFGEEDVFLKAVNYLTRKEYRS